MELKEKGDNAQIGAFDQLKVSLIWSSNVDLDLMAFYRSQDGETGGVYSSSYSGGDLGSLNQFPYMQLSGDEGVGSGGGTHRETLRIADFDELEALYVCAVNYTDAIENNHPTFADYDARVEIETDQGDDHDIRLDSRDRGAVAVLAKLESGFMGPEVVNSSEVLTFEGFQQQVPGAGEISADGTSIDAKLQQEAPELELPSKRANEVIKRKGLGDEEARVALCLDISGSMESLYNSGKIQSFAERVLALGCRFDDDGEIDVFLFGRDAYDVGGMGLENFQNYVQRQVQTHRLEGATNYGKAIELIRTYYFEANEEEDSGGGLTGWVQDTFSSDDTERTNPVSAPLPVYVMFLTDGAASDKRRAERQITWASYEPIFWQFMAIDQHGSVNFGFLEELDDMGGRHVDNANFFSTSGPDALGDEELYEKMMGEYPQWLELARNRGLLTS